MLNKAMERKLKEGDCIDLSGNARDGKYYIIPSFQDDVDYCDKKAEIWIWSIGQRLSDGKILASPAPDLYENPDFECLWLR